MKRSHMLLVLFCAGMVFEILLQPRTIDNVMASASDYSSKIKILMAVIETIQRSYVEEVPPDNLIDDAIKGMLAGLDPHTAYLPVDNFEKWNQHFEGFSGIGISYAIIRKSVTVISVLDGGPAQRAGLLPGDRIVAINGVKVAGLKHDEVPQRIMGASGSRVEILLDREGWQMPRRIVLVRDHVQINSIPVSAMIRPGIGYVKIERFSSTTGGELDAALKTLAAEGMEQLIVDLRGNSGGYLSAAVEVADKFLPAGKLIVYTRGRSAASFQEYDSEDDSRDFHQPMIVLIDHATASASEIVAGALQDWDRALIAGKSSFGKGLVQSQYRFADGSALLITTAKYYTPAGRLIQRSYANKTKDEYYFEAYDDSVLADGSSGNVQSCLTAAGRTVYGGGGVSPDVRIDTKETQLDEDLRRLYFSDQRIFYTYLKNYVERHPEVRQNNESFIRSFAVSDSMLEELAAVAEELQAYFPWPLPGKNRQAIKFLLKRDLAYLLWGEVARLKINLEQDSQLREALEHFPEARALLALSRRSATALRLPQK